MPPNPTRSRSRPSRSSNRRTYACDFDFFPREIPFVDYVRDRQDADVHLLVTSQVWSLTDRWLAGFESGAEHSTFRNRELALRLAPAIEWNLFR